MRERKRCHNYLHIDEADENQNGPSVDLRVTGAFATGLHVDQGDDVVTREDLIVGQNGENIIPAGSDDVERDGYAVDELPWPSLFVMASSGTIPANAWISALDEA